MKIVKTVNDMDKIEKIRQESEELYAHIDECIGALIKARLNKDTDGEGKSLFQMEGLMVGTQQFLCWISDTLSEEPDKSLEEKLNEEIKRFVAEYGYERSEDILLIAIVARHFAKWQKEQMMKEAVEYEVVDFSSSLETHPHVNIPLDNKKYRSGDTVRVIILPKED